MDQTERRSPPHRESPLTSMIVNILAPIMILNQTPKFFPTISPWAVLAVAMCFPLFGATENWRRRGRIGLLPGLGAINVIGTGGLAALGVGGIWFAVKEALFPFLIGLFVLRSAFGKSPFAESLFLNDAFVQTEKAQSALQSRGEIAAFRHRLKISTLWIAASFFLSAALNFILAVRVFTPLAENLTASERTHALNQQVAEMTGWGFAVIALPSMICMGLILWTMLSDLRRLTGLNTEEIFRD